MAKKRYYNSDSGGGFERDMYRPEAIDEGPYAGMESRRRQEMQDAGMLREDHRAVANLPQEVIMRAYPKEHGYIPMGLDDTLRGVDGQMGLDHKKTMKHLHPEKV